MTHVRPICKMSDMNCCTYKTILRHTPCILSLSEQKSPTVYPAGRVVVTPAGWKWCFVKWRTGVQFSNWISDILTLAMVFEPLFAISTWE